jgi:hypothetical protein
MDDITYVGLDVHKAAVCVALAESGRGGEVRQIGVFENRPENGYRLCWQYFADISGASVASTITPSAPQDAPNPLSSNAPPPANGRALDVLGFQSYSRPASKPDTMRGKCVSRTTHTENTNRTDNATAKEPAL